MIQKFPVDPVNFIKVLEALIYKKFKVVGKFPFILYV